MSERECLGGVQSCERLARYLDACQTWFLAEACRVAEPEFPAPEVMSADRAIAAELVPMFALTKARADLLVRQARQLTADHSGLLDLVRTGDLDLYRAVLIDELMREDLEPGSPVWDEVTKDVSEMAPGATVSRLRRAVRRMIDTRDAEASARRHKKAKARRSVTMYPLSDGMAVIAAKLSADRAINIDAVLDAMADACRDYSATAGAPDPRTHQQRRADALTSVFDAIGNGTPLPLVPQPGPTGAPGDGDPLQGNTSRAEDAPSADGAPSGDGAPGEDDVPGEDDGLQADEGLGEDGLRHDGPPEDGGPPEDEGPQVDDTSHARETARIGDVPGESGAPSEEDGLPGDLAFFGGSVLPPDAKARPGYAGPGGTTARPLAPRMRPPAGHVAAAGRRPRSLRQPRPGTKRRTPLLKISRGVSVEQMG